MATQLEPHSWDASLINDHLQKWYQFHLSVTLMDRKYDQWQFGMHELVSQQKFTMSLFPLSDRRAKDKRIEKAQMDQHMR